MQYSVNDLAIIIPTKDRPEQVRRHLQSLVDQVCELGRVIIVASGQDIKDIVADFEGKLPVEYYRSGAGQIKQRNYGISLLDDRTRLVATMDDDITYEPGAIFNMISFWNQHISDNIGGVGYNIINQSAHKYSFIWAIINGKNYRYPGRVMKTGFATPLSNVNANIKTDWLNGGGTVWRQSVILSRSHKEIKSRWAVYEDVIYSYPLGKKYDLYVCKDAKIELEFLDSNKNKYKSLYFTSKSIAIWRLYFVLLNSELSVFRYILDLLFEINLNIIKAVVRFDVSYLIISFAFAVGLVKVLPVKNSIDKLTVLIEGI